MRTLILHTLFSHMYAQIEAYMSGYVSSYVSSYINALANSCKRLSILVFVLLLVVATKTQAENCTQEQQCIEEEQFSFGVAIGIGARSNPVEGGSAIPQVLLLDIAWYSDDFYFDNGELGIRWIDSQHYGLESYVTFDRERAFFSFWDPANIIVNTAAIGTDGDNDISEQVEVDINDISSRSWAALAGTRFNYFQDTHKFSFAIESDISGVHSGQRFLVSYQKTWLGDDWRFQVRPSLIYKTSSLIDYYYGLTAKDNVPRSAYFEAKGGLQPGISFLYTRKISDDWQFISSASYLRLHSGMTDSPLVKSKEVVSLFVGAGYRF